MWIEIPNEIKAEVKIHESRPARALWIEITQQVICYGCS